MERCLRNPLKMRQFLVFLRSDGAGARWWAAGAARDGRRWMTANCGMVS